MLSIKYAGEDNYKSTYNSWFHLSPKDLKPKKIYREYPSYSDDHTNLAAIKRLDVYRPSKKKVKPPSYKRYFPTCLGLGCFGDVPLFNTDKDIVKTVPPKKRINNPKPKPPVLREQKPLKDQTLEEMFLNTKWVSTKTRNDRNNSLPIQKFDVPKNTVEENPDMARYQFQRREDHIGDWQTAGYSWDRLQLRENHYYEKPDCLRKIDEADMKKQKIASWKRKPGSLIPKDIKPFSMALQCKERQIPGYNGYVPMEPVECTFDPYLADLYQSNARGNYRKYPEDVFDDLEQPRRVVERPFSRMITRVPPHNPFRNLPEKVRTNTIRTSYH